MIKISENAVIIVLSDGTRQIFDFAGFLNRLEASCIACGFCDNEIAEDIAFSVEHILRNLASSGRIFTISEIDSFVIEILENTGFNSVAEHYKRLDGICPSLKLDNNTIRLFIKNNFRFSNDEVNNISEKLLKILQQSGFTEAPPRLISEFAKFLYETKKENLKFTDFSKTSQKVDFKDNSKKYYLNHKEIINALEKNTLSIINQGIIKVQPVSCFFPVLKLELNLFKLCEIRKLPSPVLEIELFPHLKELAKPLNEIIGTGRNLFSQTIEISHKNSQNSLPVSIRMPDLNKFALNFLGTSRISPELLSEIIELFDLEKNIGFPEIAHLPPFF